MFSVGLGHHSSGLENPKAGQRGAFLIAKNSFPERSQMTKCPSQGGKFEFLGKGRRLLWSRTT